MTAKAMYLNHRNIEPQHYRTWTDVRIVDADQKGTSLHGGLLQMVPIRVCKRSALHIEGTASYCLSVRHNIVPGLWMIVAGCKNANSLAGFLAVSPAASACSCSMFVDMKSAADQGCTLH